MANFIEITAEFELNESLNDDSWTGNRVFMQADSPSATMLPNVVAEASLPQKGEVWPASLNFGLTIPANLIVRNIRRTLDGGDLTQNVRISIEYSTRDESSQNQPSNDVNSESITISSFHRTISLSKAKNAEKIKDANGNVLDLLTVREVRATYTKTQVGYATLVLAAASGSETGKVLTSNKNWLSLGTNVAQYDEDNVVMFRAARSYSYKKIVSPDGRIDDHTWQADWFVKPAKFKLATANLYEEVATFVDAMPPIT